MLTPESPDDDDYAVYADVKPLLGLLLPRQSRFFGMRQPMLLTDKPTEIGLGDLFAFFCLSTSNAAAQILFELADWSQVGAHLISATTLRGHLASASPQYPRT